MCFNILMHCTLVPVGTYQPVKCSIRKGTIFFNCIIFCTGTFFIQSQRKSKSNAGPWLGMYPSYKTRNKVRLHQNCICFFYVLFSMSLIFSIFFFLLIRSIKKFSIPDRQTGFLWTIHALTTRIFSIKVRVDRFQSE